MYCDETYLYSMLTFQASRSYSWKCVSVYKYKELVIFDSISSFA